MKPTNKPNANPNTSGATEEGRLRHAKEALLRYADETRTSGERDKIFSGLHALTKIGNSDFTSYEYGNSEHSCLIFVINTDSYDFIFKFFELSIHYFETINDFDEYAIVWPFVENAESARTLSQNLLDAGIGNFSHREKMSPRTRFHVGDDRLGYFYLSRAKFKHKFYSWEPLKAIIAGIYLEKPIGLNTSSSKKMGKIRSTEVSEILNSWFSAKGVAEAARPALAAEFNRIIARITRPKWSERHAHAELAGLTAVEFLKHVHADDIIGGVVNKETIRAIDEELMDRVEGYIGSRKARGADAGLAKGLVFELSHPARNAVPTVVKPPKNKAG